MDANQLRELIIRPALKHMNMHSAAAENLMLGTCFQESLGGFYLKQIGGGPALGIFQMEPNTHDDIWENYLAYKTKHKENITKLLSPESKLDQLVSNLKYATVMARLVYWRQPTSLPDADDVQGLAEYWKKHYNTEQGAGSPAEFVEHYQRNVSNIA